ncbi:threonine--tRNA ligase [Candidatus Gottesmanbacteria bacterium]|nr:threonine--tRNA ligase [Candidatus Gottesmanbacteria bacterium]
MENKQENLDHLRHSCAHLLAAAVMELWPQAKRTIGPAIENGFYYDFDNLKISEDDLPKIEVKMHELAVSWNKFEKIDVNRQEAKKAFADNPYKLELIGEFSAKGENLTLYKSGNYIDLCRGGHCEHPDRQLKYFKLLSIAGAYWRGSEKNAMLTRIYGTCFPTEKELNDYLAQLEEAKKHDHRKLGKELELFMISEEVGQGLVLWLPKGNIVKEEIEQWVKVTEKQWGYQRVTTPNITKSGLYYTSGHLPYYKNDMYPPMMLEDGNEYYLKPMNCPHHHMIYKNKPRSYRDLPVRLAEYGTCYRYEASGELFGLMRVRGFSQNDAHIYCSLEQAVGEFVQVMKLHEYYYKALGITKYHLELALRDPTKAEKYHGDEAMWKLAEDLMRKAVAKMDIPMVEEIGNAAFYGPKIDFIIHSSIGRQFAISTNQIDLYMGKRFGLAYVDKEGKEQTPVIIHRAPLGSHERFIGFLIEHYGGAFPLWLAPIQMIIIPIAERHTASARHLQEDLLQNGIRAEVDGRNEPMGAKIRNATLQKVPYMGIMGDKEIEAKGLSIRTRAGVDLKMMNFHEVKSLLRDEIETKR